MSTDFTKNDSKSSILQENVHELQRQQSDVKQKYVDECPEEEHKIDVGEFIIPSDSIKKEMDEEFIPFDEHYQPKQVHLNTIIKEENVELQNIKEESETNSKSLSDSPEIVQCECCKIHLVQQEYLEHHISYCWNNRSGTSRLPAVVDRTSDIIDATTQQEFVESFNEMEHKQIVVSKPDIDSESYCVESVLKKEFSNNSDLNKDVENKHTKVHINRHKSLECDVCNKKFTTKRSLKAHLNVHLKPFQCHICNTKFSRKSKLAIHLNTHNGVKAFECHICEKKFTQKSSLKTHLNVHNDANPFECNICMKKFTQKGSLERHLNEHDGVKRFQCGICEKKFSRKSNLKTHLDGHNDRFDCDICMKKFPSKYYLRKHLYEHNVVEPIECDVCNKKFTTKQHLKTHLDVVHNGVKASFECDICNKKFTQNGNLKRHLNVHDGVKRFQCDICNK